MDNWQIDSNLHATINVEVVGTTTERRTMGNNEYLKDIMYRHRIAQWALAKELGVSENTVQRKLRTELEEDLYEVYLNAVKAILKEHGIEWVHKDS